MRRRERIKVVHILVSCQWRCMKIESLECRKFNLFLKNCEAIRLYKIKVTKMFKKLLPSFVSKTQTRGKASG